MSAAAVQHLLEATALLSPDRIAVIDIGELGLLAVPMESRVRLRYNPFFSYLERRTTQFLRLEDARRVR